MTSATDAELAALYIRAREAVYIRMVLEKMGHQQPPTTLQIDNAMAEAVVNSKVQPKQTKAMDMQFHWLRDRECENQTTPTTGPNIIRRHIVDIQENNS